MELEDLASARTRWAETLDRATAFGIEWRGSRFEIYLAVIDELIRLGERRKTDADAYRAFREDLGRQELLFEGASQVIQLRVASRVWDRLDPGVLASKLKKVIRGEPLPLAVAGSENRADESRDTLVELLAAALMAESGFKPELTSSDEDVRFLLTGRPTIVAECKRPVSKDTLPTTLSRLRSQFWKRKKQGALLCMPILAVERVEPFAGILTRAESEWAVDQEVQRQRTVAINEIRRICAEIPRHGLGDLSPVGIVTLCGAVLVHQPITHVYYFTSREPFDTGREDHSPEWLVEQFNHSEGLLTDFT